MSVWRKSSAGLRICFHFQMAGQPDSQNHRYPCPTDPRHRSARSLHLPGCSSPRKRKPGDPSTRDRAGSVLRGPCSPGAYSRAVYTARAAAEPAPGGRGSRRALELWATATRPWPRLFLARRSVAGLAREPLTVWPDAASTRRGHCLCCCW